MQKLIMPMWNVNITQRENGGFSHKGINAIDLAGKDSGREQVFAPADCKIVKRYAYAGMGNAVIYQSLAKVKWADGSEDFFTMMLMHANNISDLTVGKTFKQFSRIYTEGSFGYATGNHVHLEIRKGKSTAFASNGWSLASNINTQKAFFISSKHKIYGLLGNSYKKTDSWDVVVSKPKIKKWAKKQKFKSKENNLHVRLSPSTSGKHYRYLHKKTAAINYWGEITTNGRKWYVYTNIKNQTCYVAAQFLKKA